MKKVLMVILAVFILSGSCYAAEEVHFEVETMDFDEQNPPKELEYFGKEDGYITTINNEQFYVNNYKRYYDYQKLYSRDVFEFFKETLGYFPWGASALFQYEKTENGYIACTPAYRINMQNMGWTSAGDIIYLYDNNLNLIGEMDFSTPDFFSHIRSVDYINGNYIVELVNGGRTRNEPIYRSYKMSVDFVNWIECENPRTLSEYEIVCEDGINFLSNRLGPYYRAYNTEQRKSYISSNGIYYLEMQFGDPYWEDDRYLYMMKPYDHTCLKTEKQPLYDRLNALKEIPCVVLNGTILGFAQPPVIEDDRMLVPMRFLFEQLGATVDWEEATMTAIAKKDDMEIQFSIDNISAEVDGKTETMDVPARLIGDKTMVPLRFLSESLDYDVQWDEDTNMAIVTTKK